MADIAQNRACAWVPSGLLVRFRALGREHRPLAIVNAEADHEFQGPRQNRAPNKRTRTTEVDVKVISTAFDGKNTNIRCCRRIESLGNQRSPPASRTGGEYSLDRDGWGAAWSGCWGFPGHVTRTVPTATPIRSRGGSKNLAGWPWLGSAGWRPGGARPYGNRCKGCRPS